MASILEPAREIPVCSSVDLCIVGGSCTGVFAAIRAARLGLKVALVEKQNALGGTATNGLVNVWHKLHDTSDSEQIIAGLTFETLERLKKHSDVLCLKDQNSAFVFNSQELKIELDQLVQENHISVFLHSFYAGIQTHNHNINAVFIENKDGRQAIQASFFIDATGDGDLARDLGIESYQNAAIQPPTACFLMQGSTDGIDLPKIFHEHAAEFGLPMDWGWDVPTSDLDKISMRAEHHVYGMQCQRARDLTFAEMEGRRLMRAFLSLMRKYGRIDQHYALVSACSHLGIRETVHYLTQYQITDDDLLFGREFEDAILKGSYRIDIHHAHDKGITFQYLDGRTETYLDKTQDAIWGNWREDRGIISPPATYYQAPFRMLVGDTFQNFLCVGRMINATPGAFGALRVMVNLNQLGEAAGVAAYLSIHTNEPIQKVSGIQVRKRMKEGGSAL